MKTKTRAPRQTKRVRLQKRMEGALTELARGELVRPWPEVEPAYVFKHVLVQDTAQASLLNHDRKRLHRRVAEAYESIYADRCMDEFAALLAQHYAEAGDDAKTLEYATRAGDRAAHMYANAEAIAFFTQALEAASRSEATTDQWIHLYRQKVRAHELSAQYEQALAVCAEMERLGHQRGARAIELAAQLARLPIIGTPTAKFDPAAAERLAGQALALARELGDRAAEAKALWLRMLIMLRSLRPQEGIADGEASLALARTLHLREQLAYTLHDLSNAYVAVGDFERGITLSRQARELWRELDNKPMLADNLSSNANGLIFAGELDQVIALSEEAFHITTTIGNLWGQAYSLSILGQAYTERGDYARAMTTMHDCIYFAEQAGFFVPLVQTRIGLAEAYSQIGATGHARETARDALIQTGRLDGLPYANMVLSRVHLYLLLNEHASAEAALQEAKVLAVREAISGFLQLLLVWSDIKLCVARGENPRALALMADLIPLLRAHNLILFLPEIFYHKGRALLDTGARDAAYDALLEADTYAQHMNSRRMSWKIYAALSELATQRGNAEQAHAYQEQARQVIEFIVEHMPQEFRETFLNLPQVRKVMD